MKSLLSSIPLFRRFLFCLLCFSALGCAAIPTPRANYGFSFSTFDQVPEIVVLEYQLGEKGPRTQPDQGMMKRDSIIGEMEIPAFLYVKWQRLDSKETFSRTINLQGLLPPEMAGKHLKLEFNGSNFAVFLKDRKKVRPPGTPIVGPYKTQTYVTTQVFSTSYFVKESI